MKCVKRYIVFLIVQMVAALGSHCFAQITIQNPSFELDNKVMWGKPAKYWDTCVSFYPEIIDSTPSTSGYFFPPPTPNGKYYCDIETDGYTPSKFSYLTTKLSCPTYRGQIHKMSIWAMGYFAHFNSVAPHALGYFTIHLGHSACDSFFIVYESPIMPDTLFLLKYEFTFIHDDNYEYIGIQAHQPHTFTVIDLLIDNFSPITVQVTNVAQIVINDIDKHSCYKLGVENVNGVRYEWQQNGAVISTQATVENVCVGSPTTISVSVWDACGYEYVDTLQLNSSPLITSFNANESKLSIALTPFYEDVQVSIYNALGQLENTTTIASQNTQANIDISNLTTGVYFIVLSNHNVFVRKKFVKSK